MAREIKLSEINDFFEEDVVDLVAATTLEWTAPVEHMHGNWPGEIPHVYRWAYDYSKPGHEEDFVPQIVPLADDEDITEH